jgi:signal transduction histidine kinase
MFFSKLARFFLSRERFDAGEWLLKYQIFAILIISSSFGAGVLIFSFFRMREGNYIVGLSQLILGILMLYGFFRLRDEKTYYHQYSIWFMLFFFTYTAIVFFYVPQNHLNILWVIAAPILIFFFLNRSGGVIMFVMVLLFILYLIAIQYPYTIAEYVTLIGAFLITTFVMYTYEKVKEAEKHRLILYNRTLVKKVNEKTEDLMLLNRELEQRVEEELERRLSQEQMLLRQYRMASLGQMIDVIAHQWQQPLMNINAILINIDREIERSNPSGEYIAKKTAEINTLTAYMSTTIKDFRYLFKEKKEKVNILVHILMEELLRIMHHSLRSTTIKIACEPEVTVSGYKSELTQVMMILFSNAQNALSQKKIKAPYIRVSVDQIEAYTMIRLEDNAGGVTVESMENIFEPYYTTNTTETCSGLGLYIAKIIIVHNMQGEISVQNQEEGACFTIKLPR